MNEQPEATSTPAPIREDVTGSRIVAALIDIAVLFVVFLVMAALFGDFGSTEESDFAVNLSGPAFVVFLLIVFAYHFVLESSGGQTLGKKVMGLKVVAVDGALTSGNVAVRTILRIVDGLPIFYLVGFIAVVATKQKQRLGDMAARTLVVRA